MIQPHNSRGTFAISWGSSGGFYWRFSSATWRICLWRVALTVVWEIEIDDMLSAFLSVNEQKPK